MLCVLYHVCSCSVRERAATVRCMGCPPAQMPPGEETAAGHHVGRPLCSYFVYVLCLFCMYFTCISCCFLCSHLCHILQLILYLLHVFCTMYILCIIFIAIHVLHVFLLCFILCIFYMCLMFVFYYSWIVHQKWTH